MQEIWTEETDLDGTWSVKTESTGVKVRRLIRPSDEFNLKRPPSFIRDNRTFEQKVEDILRNKGLIL